MVLSEEIAKIAKEQVINNTSPPIEVKITKVYTDGFIDVTFTNGEFFHIKCNGSAKVGDAGVVIFIDNDTNNPFCLIGGSGSGDLSNYVTKQLLNNILSSYVTATTLDDYALINHIHDDRYYTETEIDRIINSLVIPSKTSDLINDGEDGTNVFVSDNDSRLSNARTPTSHTHTKSNITDFAHSHGNITNNGQIGNSANKVIMTQTGGILIAVSTIGATNVADVNAHSNIGSSASATQGAINTAIDTAIGNKADASDLITGIVLVPKSTDANGKIIFYTNDEPT